MRRMTRGKPKKSETNSDGEEELNSSVKTDNDETGSNNDTEASTAGKKRNARGRVKASEDDHEEDKEETVEQENGKPPNKRRKKDNDESIEESDKESDKSIGKKKDEIEENGKSSPSKSKKKTKAAQKQEEEEDLDDGEEYEVEKIIDQRTIKGRRQFLVRWKGYTGEHDTWEQEKELNCDRLIEEFLAEQEENNESFEQEEKSKDKTEKKTKAKKEDKKAKKSKKSSKVKDAKDNENGNDDDEEEDTKEYEVEKIVEVYFKKDKTREFLIRWKGFSSNSDTWEPEENLNCPELINKFMEKLEKIKNTDSRELRVNPGHTKRYTLTMHADKRQSRRNANKERVSYHEYDA